MREHIMNLTPSPMQKIKDGKKTIELRLYDEIVYQICTNYAAFKESGISKEEIEQTLTYIEDEVQKRETEGNAVADNLKAEILSVAVLGKRQIEAAFSDAAQRRTKTIS